MIARAARDGAAGQGSELHVVVQEAPRHRRVDLMSITQLGELRLQCCTRSFEVA